MRTPEEEFVKAIEDFFYYDYKLKDSDKKRIHFLLLQYKERIAEVKIVSQNFVIYKNNIGYEVTPESNRKLLPLSEMKEEFDRFCKKRNYKYVQLKKQGRSTKEITKIRSEFCNHAAENFLVSKSELALFFGLNHATIHYYFNPKSKEK